jgi:hypothetical protein
MRKDYLIVGIAIISGVLIYSRWTAKSNLLVVDRSKQKVPIVDDRKNYPNPNEKTVDDSSEKIPNEVVEKKTQIDPVVAENFKNHLIKVLDCIEPGKKSSLAVGLSPNFENLIQVFNDNYGQYVVSLEDWIQSDIKLSDGTLRRVRIDTTYLDQSSPERRMSVFGIDPQGYPLPLDLDLEKAQNPDDEYISSFLAGAEPVLVEKSERVYFQNGEELIVVETNGQVESITFSGNGKTATCSGLDKENSSCQCY